MHLLRQHLPFALCVLLVLGSSTARLYCKSARSTEKEQGESRFISNVRQLIFEGRRSGEGYFNRDGSLLAFMSERDPANPFFQIYLMDMSSGDTHRVSPGVGKTTCPWIHPSNQKLLFSSTHEDPNALKKQKDELDYRASGAAKRYGWEFDEFYDIYESDLQGKQLRTLSDVRGYDAEACYSPDGKTIVFASNRLGYSAPMEDSDRRIFEKDPSYMMDIYLMDADGSNVRRVTDVKGYDGGPFFCWDGSKICWRRFTPDGVKAEVFTMNADGTDQRQLTHLDAMSWAPFFHPSGDYLIFATNKHGFSNFELYLVDAAGKSTVRVTSTDGFDGLPAFSPDGRRLVWTAQRTSDKSAQLFSAEWNDSEARRQLGLAETPSAPAPAKPASGGAAPNFDLSKTSPEITPADLRIHITRLASEEMQGRMAGTKGAELATEYVASVFNALGLKPEGDKGTYYQEFEFTAGVSPGPNNRLEISKSEGSSKPKIEEAWRPLALSKTGQFGPADVVFAGYGINAPKTEGFEGYNSYQDLDVAGKWVLMLRFLPEDVKEETRQHLSRFSNLRYKAMAAREKGALGIIVASGPRSKVKEQLVKLAFDASMSGSSIAGLSINDALAAEMIQSAGRDLVAVQTELDTGKPATGFAIPGVKVSADIDIKQEKKTARNVVARLDASESSNEAVAIGAHVDHLGVGDGTSSLARDDEKGKPHYGADDNASGVAAMLEMAQQLKKRKESGTAFKRDFLFGAWSAEELGLIGSTHFTRVFGDGAERKELSPDLAAYLNLDMVGRLTNKLILQGVGSSSVWASEIEQRNAVVGLPVVTQNESYLPTDATAFYLKKVPILSAFTGAHEDYHTPRDTPDKINYEGTERIARLMGLIAESLAKKDQAPDYKEMEKPRNMSGGGRRVYLGTIPDFSQGDDLVGVKLSGVQKGGPADLAGVRAGDVIVELAGKAVANIYDYQFAMTGLKVGTPSTIVVQRGSEKIKLAITPGSRD